MKKGRNAAKTATYTAGIFIIASALLLAVLLFMCALGFIYPRKEHIAVRTDSVSKIYDGEPISGGEPALTYGVLHKGHKITTVSEAIYTKVGVYTNEPKFIITDISGADVTDMYVITAEFGEIVIDGRPITVYSKNKEKVYDGAPLVADEFFLLESQGTLFEGHTFVTTSLTSITTPGEVRIEPNYRIVDRFGANVTDQYSITESLGKLTVKPISLKITTESARKFYDGTPISANGYTIIGVYPAEHTITVTTDAQATEVGTYVNTPKISITDIQGNDVSSYYDITESFGNLTIYPLTLKIVTGTAQKMYDGTPLECVEWNITNGALLQGDTIAPTYAPSLDGVGKIDNEIQFKITDKNGNDVTRRYDITQVCGSLYVTPRTLTIRTGTASKIYDGEALICEEYEMIAGSLCEGDELELSFTSIVNIGYSENYIIAFNIYKTEKDGSKTDVSFCYSVTYDCGILTVTAN